MAGTETNLVARLRQEFTHQAANMAGTDNSDFHAATITPMWEIQPNQSGL